MDGKALAALVAEHGGMCARFVRMSALAECVRGSFGCRGGFYALPKK